MENEHSIAIVPFSIKAIDRNYESIIIKLDQWRTELINSIKSHHACQISSITTPIKPNANDPNALSEVCIKFVIWGQMKNVVAARKELLRSNLSEVILNI